MVGDVAEAPRDFHLLFLCFRYSDLDQSYSMSEGDKDEDGDEDEDEEEYVKLICHSKFL